MTGLRSLLFVPGDRPDRMEKALTSGADTLILDLEDAVAVAAKPSARTAIAAFLNRPRSGPQLFVRVNPLFSGLIEDDLAAILPNRPDAIVLPKAEGSASIANLDALSGNSLPPVLPIAAETPAAIFQFGGYASMTARLVGLTWGSEDLSAAVGAATARETDGRYTSPYEIARALTLFAAYSADVPAIDTVFPNFRDPDGLAAYAARAARDGFSGMMAIHPVQVPAINAAFTPSAEALAQARSVNAAFAANPGSGVLNLGGRMIDAPHLKMARRLLRSVGEG